MEILMKKNNFIILSLIVSTFFMSACNKQNESIKDSQAGENPYSIDEKKIPLEQGEMSAWTVYWNQETAYQELNNLGNKIQKLSHFSAYFQMDNSLFIPENVTNFFVTIKNSQKNSYIHYLSFVNDKLLEDGKSLLKDTQLLYDIFSDEFTRKNHIDSIIRLSLEGGYDGIEIDYEGIRSDQQLWQYFTQFINELYAETEEKKLLLRVVLEPSAPVDELELPKGPEYIMMCYNLYGIGTEPGPKANSDFIIEMVQKMKMLDESFTVAFATGGFDWYDGTAVAVTEFQANELVQLYQVDVLRDEASQSLVFKYTDEHEREHEVWFADIITLNFWIETSKTHGVDSFAIWRLGGNTSFL